MRSKRWMGALAILAFFPLDCLPANDLLNASFEEPLEPEPPTCDRAAGWQRWGAWANRRTDKSDVYGRNSPAYLSYEHWSADSPDSGWSQVVSNLTADHVYRFAVWVNWEPYCNARGVELRIEPLVEGASPAVARYSKQDVGDIWELIGVQVRLPKQAEAVRCVIRCTHGFSGDRTEAHGALRFDDASLQDLIRSPAKK